MCYDTHVRKSFGNILVIIGGNIYTVETVSEKLGVPRPTLYRYLKEYSIPYQRSSGRISIPDESVERIRRVRELHDEGLGTAAVRKRVKDGDAEVDWIAERLDQLSEAVASSQRGSGARSIESVSSNQALHIILARQSVMLQAIYNLNEMVEELMSANGRPRRSSSLNPLSDTALQSTTSQNDIVGSQPLASTDSGLNIVGSRPSALIARPYPNTPTLQRREGFETLARKRRRNTIALIIGLSLTICASLWFLLQIL